MSHNSSSSWSIVVKTVGKGFENRRCIHSSDEDNTNNDDGLVNSSSSSKRGSTALAVGSDGTLSFSVNVSPDDKVDSLHDEIEDITGVKPSQQRLIYRGRLIGKTDVGSLVVSENSKKSSNSNRSSGDSSIWSNTNSNSSSSSSSSSSSISNDEHENEQEHKTTTNDNDNNHNLRKDPKICQHPKEDQHQEYKIKDIVGLCDGQTIHLVKKRDDDTKKTNTTGTEAVGQDDTNRNSDIGDDNNDSTTSSTESDRAGSGGSGALLAALLGLGSLAEESGPISVGGPEAVARERTGMGAGVSTNNRISTRTNQNPPWMTTSNNNNSNSNSNTGETATAGISSGRTPRHIRRQNYRLVAEDLEVADPGSMESVRQGLMTLNTIINSQPNSSINCRVQNGGGGRHQQQRSSISTPNNHHLPHPLQTNREWFRGQWIDARDTVNQWLEATVMDIVDPLDVLNDAGMLHTDTPAHVHATRYGTSEQNPPRQRRVPNIDNDPAISANDLEGRRRLLLEECEPEDPREIDPSNIGNIDFAAATATISDSVHGSANINVSQLLSGRALSFRPRSNNDGVQLLLIHYNGWPHRWDEWIRSDSERLRPFRTRTRHSSMSTLASPTPQSILNEAPRTNIVQDGDEEDDRLAVLPQLNFAISRVSGLIGDIIYPEQERDVGRGINNPSVHSSRECDEDEHEHELEDLYPSNNCGRTTNTGTSTSTNHRRRTRAGVPWIEHEPDSVSADVVHRDYHNSIAMSNSEHNNGDRLSEAQFSNIEVPDDNDENHHETKQTVDNDNGNEAAISDGGSSSLVHDRNTRDSRTTSSSYTQAELHQLATLFDRLGRTLTDAAPHIASLAASLSPQEVASHNNNSSIDDGTENSNTVDYERSSAPLGGLLSLWSRERERRRQILDQENPTTRRSTTISAPIDPDHIDFASGLVNTMRGEVRSGPRSRASHQDDVASFLGSYLAAASLGSIGASNDENGDNSSGFARLLQRGSGGGSGDNGIDIHIHAIVTAPGVSPGGMGIANLSNGGGGTPTATTLAGATRSVFASNLSSVPVRASVGTSLSDNIVEPTDEEDYSDLFSELYSESPTPIDPNGSPGQGGSEESAVSPPSRNGAADDDDDGNANNSSNNLSSPISSNNITIEEHESTFDAASVVTPSGSNSNRSTRQASERRSGVFRLFRRRSSRTNYNQDGSNSEGT